MINVVEEIIRVMCAEFAYESIQQYKKNKKYRNLIDDESVSVDEKIKITDGNFLCWADEINRACDCETYEACEPKDVMSEAEAIIRNAAKRTGDGVEEYE